MDTEREKKIKKKDTGETDPLPFTYLPTHLLYIIFHKCLLQTCVGCAERQLPVC